jgi:hypothetical protein
MYARPGTPAAVTPIIDIDIIDISILALVSRNLDKRNEPRAKVFRKILKRIRERRGHESQLRV